jgi:cell pole-organizing protein PopZ
MSAEQAQREPTMEEILASIRRIISEEDRPADAGGDVLDLQPPAPPVVETKAPVRPEPEPAPVFRSPAFEEPEELPSRPLEDDLMIVEAEEEEFVEPEPVFTPPPVAAAAKAAVREAEWRPMEQETLTSEPVATHAAGSLSRLMGTMQVSTGATLDDVVRELLKPMLKEWLDTNLSQIVEAEVAKEIDRIRRMSR